MKITRHVVQPHEYDEIPELTEEWFASADHHRGGKLVRRGRPKSDDPKQLVSLRLDAEVLRWFKRTGAGYQSRIGDVLRRHVQRNTSRKIESRLRRGSWFDVSPRSAGVAS